MLQSNWIPRMVCGAVVRVSLVSAAPADGFVEFIVSREQEDDRYRAGIFVEITGATGVELLPQGGGVLPFEVPYDEPEAFWLQRSDFATLAALNANIAGTHTLRVTHPGGISEYQYTREVVTEGIFPKVPVLDAVPAIIGQMHNFTWTWAGTAGEADEMYATARIYDRLAKGDNDEGGFVIGVTTNWTPDFRPETGNGQFVIDYSFVGAVELGTGITISGWQLLSGDELLDAPGDEIDDCVDSQDTAYFTVVPEPATMGLLALGVLTLLGRRRRA